MLAEGRESQNETFELSICCFSLSEWIGRIDFVLTGEQLSVGPAVPGEPVIGLLED